MFNTFCWWLNVLKLAWLAALLRWLAYRSFQGQAQLSKYARPVAGYQGWIEVPHFGTVAFIPINSDKPQFRW